MSTIVTLLPWDQWAGPKPSSPEDLALPTAPSIRYLDGQVIRSAVPVSIYILEGTIAGFAFAVLPEEVL